MFKANYESQWHTNYKLDIRIRWITHTSELHDCLNGINGAAATPWSEVGAMLLKRSLFTKLFSNRGADRRLASAVIVVIFSAVTESTQVDEALAWPWVAIDGGGGGDDDNMNNNDDDVEAGGDNLDDTDGGLCIRGGTGGEDISGGLSKLEFRDEELSESSEGCAAFDWFRSILLYGWASSSSNMHNAPSDRASGALWLADGCFGVFTRDPLRSGLIVLQSKLYVGLSCASHF